MARSKHSSKGTFHQSDGHAALGEYLKAIDPMKADAAPYVPDLISVAIYKIHVDAGHYSLVSAGTLQVRPDSQSARPSRFASVDNTGGAFLDDFFARGRAYKAATDQDVWNAALDFASDAGLTGFHLRTFSEGIGLALVIRAGATKLGLEDISKLVGKAGGATGDGGLPAPRLPTGKGG